MRLSKWYRIGNGDLHISVIKPPSFTISVHFGIALLRYEVELTIHCYSCWYNIPLGQFLATSQ